jgi:long-chain acyl-CoA synthetase
MDSETSETPAPQTPAWHARRSPGKPAIIMGSSGEAVSYAELDDRSARLARVLSSRGIGPGGRIAVLMENNRPFLEILWAAQRSGLYYTVVNSHLRAAEVQYVLDDCGASALITSETMRDVVSRLDLSRVSIRICAAGEVSVFERYNALLGANPAGPAPQFEGREMLYSSGTTGRPKGVRKALPGKPFGDPSTVPVQIAQTMRQRYQMSADTVYLSTAPLYHSAPLVSSMSVHRLGGTVILMEKFDPRRCLELIQRHRVTHAQFVPTMFVRLLRLAEEERVRYDTSSLQLVVHGAAPCPVLVKQQMLDWWGPIIYEFYAGTEDIGGTFITPQEWLAHPGSVGRPLTECHVVGEDGEELPPGQPGVLYFAGGRPFEYHNDTAKTASIMNDKGWRTLGDIGYRDEDGYVYLTDRAAHMIISGGVNIYPQEAENVLASHPAVADVAVLGVPDPEMGEVVKAVVQPADPAAAGPELERELLGYCRAELASYKCPRTVDFATELPRDENGKLYKRLLRERYWQGRQTRII